MVKNRDDLRSLTLLRKIMLDPAGKLLVNRLLGDYSEEEARKIIEEMLFREGWGEAGENERQEEKHFITANELLGKDWPRPRWAIPDLLPMGFTIVAGAPKIGKSWFVLQLALAVATGGVILQKKVEKGNVLYMALEDPPRRLQERMRKQGWSLGLNCDFIVMGDFERWIGKLDEKGMETLEGFLLDRDYRLIVVDTLSRAVRGDQNEVEDMTNRLSPLQVMAHRLNCALIIVDHHRKGGTGYGEMDAVSDILGSTAKGALADTTIGIYRERGKPGARLAIIGKEVEDKVLQVSFDSHRGTWYIDECEEQGVTQQQLELLNVLENLKAPTGVSRIAEEVGRQKGNVLKQLVELEKKGRVEKIDGKWAAAGSAV